MIILTAYLKVEINPTGLAWVDVTDQTISASAELALVGERANAFAFGNAVELSGNLELSGDTLPAQWDSMPVRITFGMNGTTIVVRGTISSYRREPGKIAYGYSGARKRLELTKAYTPMFNDRPLFTRTTASSIEDPADPAYEAGIGNYLLWTAGYRPLAQQSNPAYALAAVGWYECDEALLCPPWSWSAGDNAYSELLAHATACGGQIIEGLDGAIRFRQPFGIADGAGLYEFTEDVYSDVSDGADDRLIPSEVICSYIPRYAQAVQEVINDTTPRTVGPNGSDTDELSFDLNPTLPVASWVLKNATQLPDDNLLLVYPHSVQATEASLAYTQTVVVAAQRITITITNNSPVALTLERVKIKGQPVAAGEMGTVTAGSGDRTSRIGEQTIDLQTEEDAEAMARMTLLFDGQPRPTISFRAPFDPDRTIGETVLFSRAAWDMAQVPCVTVGIRYVDTGRLAEYEIVPATGIPSSSSFFQTGYNYAGQMRKLAP